MMLTISDTFEIQTETEQQFYFVRVIRQSFDSFLQIR